MNALAKIRQDKVRAMLSGQKLPGGPDPVDQIQSWPDRGGATKGEAIERIMKALDVPALDTGPDNPVNPRLSAQYADC